MRIVPNDGCLSEARHAATVQLERRDLRRGNGLLRLSGYTVPSWCGQSVWRRDRMRSQAYTPLENGRGVEPKKGGIGVTKGRCFRPSPVHAASGCSPPACLEK